MTRLTLMATLMAGLWACDDGGSDEGLDGARADAGAADAAVLDAAVLDAAVLDAAVLDAAVLDAAPEDGAAPDAAAGDAAVGDAARADAAPPACTPQALDACAYTPVVQDEPGMRRVVELEYTTVVGTPRAISIEVRTPLNASAETPIVVWSHGGSGGRNDPTDVALAWSQAFLRAGYLVIAIAHRGHSSATYTALCEALALGFCAPQACVTNRDCSAEVNGEAVPGSCDDGQCRFFKTGSWDRPNDLRAVLDWIEAEAADGILAGRADPGRVVYAGHSAGAGSTNMIAGAARRFEPGGRDRLLIDDRPLGFISCSPQGPGEDGFTEASFDSATCARLADPQDRPACWSRPHLTLTGVDDGGRGPVRRQSFDLAPPGQRFLGYITEAEAQHTTFNLEVESCERVGGTPERCAAYLTWLRSAALAFLDAVLREDLAARAYLTSENLSILSAGVLSWEQR